MNWIYTEFALLKLILARYPEVWLIPLFFMIFIIFILNFLDGNLNSYLESRDGSVIFAEALDSFVTSFTEKIKSKITHRFLIFGSLSLFIYGYIRARKKMRAF